jgi:phenylacetate-CoA ligase
MNDLFKYYAKNNLLTTQKLKEVTQLYELNDQQLLEKYNNTFLKIFRGAYKNSEFYKNLYQEHGIQVNDIKELSDIKKLPIIEKPAVRANIDKIYFGSNLIKSIGYTSGTTGTPLNIYRTPSNVVSEQAYLRHYRYSHGYRLGEPLLSIRGMLDKNTTHKFYKQANILYISSHNINAGTIDFYFKLIKDFAPMAVEAFPSLLYKICHEMQLKGYRISIPNAFTSSETLYGFQREMIEPFLQTKIHDWYGNGERTICLVQDAANRYHPLPLYSINEFDNDQIITTGLTNKNFPLIRYRVDDIIKVNGNDFYKNITSPDILEIQGRAGDNIDLKDGSSVPCIDHAFKGVNHLEMAQVHQYGTARPLEIKLVVTPAFGEQDLNIIRTKFSNMVGKDTQYMVTYCKAEDLTYSPNQKYKLVIKH